MATFPGSAFFSGLSTRSRILVVIATIIVVSLVIYFSLQFFSTKESPLARPLLSPHPQIFNPSPVAKFLLNITGFYNKPTPNVHNKPMQRAEALYKQLFVRQAKHPMNNLAQYSVPAKKPPMLSMKSIT